MNNTQHITVLGAGESGVGAAILAQHLGEHVFVSDSGALRDEHREALAGRQIEFEEGGHNTERILHSRLIIKSPGIPESVPIVQKIRQSGIEVISEIEFAARHTDATLIAVTGSNGKTTTASLIYHILNNAGLSVGLSGNIGASFARMVAQAPKEYYVLEVSSFQLDDCYRFAPHIAIITNITPDHLDRYGYEMKNYVDSKFRIAQAQTENDWFLYCADDPETLSGLERHGIRAQKLGWSVEQVLETGAWLDPIKQNIQLTTDKRDIMSIDELALQGKHNTYNSMAAGMTGRLLRIRKETIRDSLFDFDALEHRLEPVMEIHGIEFINDSKATNVNSTFYALESMKKPVIWIAGGVDKGNDYSQLMPLVGTRVAGIVCLGKDVKKLHAEFGEVVPEMVDATSMSEAVKASYKLARKGYAVLLSPACASFDLFENYEDRGRQFKNEVRKL